MNLVHLALARMLTTLSWSSLVVVVIASQVIAWSQQLPPNDSRLGVLSASSTVPTAHAQRECIELPSDPSNERVQAPDGETLVSA